MRPSAGGQAGARPTPIDFAACAAASQRVDAPSMLSSCCLELPMARYSSSRQCAHPLPLEANRLFLKSCVFYKVKLCSNFCINSNHVHQLSRANQIVDFQSQICAASPLIFDGLA